MQMVSECLRVHLVKAGPAFASSCVTALSGTVFLLLTSLLELTLRKLKSNQKRRPPFSQVYAFLLTLVLPSLPNHPIMC